MSAIDITLPRVKMEEGFRGTSYKDTEGHTTIGYGFDVDAGITEPEAAALVLAQLEERHNALLAFTWYRQLDDVRQSVCLDMSFNLGLNGLLGFPHMIAALERQDWSSAATECHVNNPELTGRYAKLAQMLLTGAVT